METSFSQLSILCPSSNIKDNCNTLKILECTQKKSTYERVLVSEARGCLLDKDRRDIMAIERKNLSAVSEERNTKQPGTRKEGGICYRQAIANSLFHFSQQPWTSSQHQLTPTHLTKHLYSFQALSLKRLIPHSYSIHQHCNTYRQTVLKTFFREY